MRPPAAGGSRGLCVSELRFLAALEETLAITRRWLLEAVAFLLLLFFGVSDVYYLNGSILSLMGNDFPLPLW